MVVNSMSYAKYDSYKDSGVDWLGKIPSDWDLLKVKNIFRLVMKFAPKNNDCELLSVYTDIGVKPRKELEERGNRATTTDGYLIVEKGDIVVNKLLAWMGAIGLSDYDGVTSPAYDVLKPKMPIEGIFYHLLFRSPQCTSELKRHSRGIMDMRLRLYFDKFGDVVVPYPNIEVQKKIVSFLAEKTAQIDQAIALKQQQIEKLNEYKQIVIQNAVTKGLNPNVPMKDSGVEWIGDIPEHWEVKKIKEIATLKGRIGFRGYNASDLVNEDEGAITISPSNILDDKTFFEKNSYLSWKKYYESPEIMIFNDDILLVKTGSTVGKVGIVKNLNQSATINPQLLVFKKVKVNKDYLFFYLYSDFFFDLIKSNSIGSTIPTISETKIKNLPVVLPPDEEQLNILQKLRIDVDRFDKISKAYQIQIDRLKEYKNILINQAVTGKIKIY